MGNVGNIVFEAWSKLGAWQKYNKYQGNCDLDGQKLDASPPNILLVLSLMIEY